MYDGGAVSGEPGSSPGCGSSWLAGYGGLETHWQATGMGRVGPSGPTGARGSLIGSVLDTGPAGMSKPVAPATAASAGIARGISRAAPAPNVTAGIVNGAKDMDPAGARVAAPSAAPPAIADPAIERGNRGTKPACRFRAPVRAIPAGLWLT